MAGKLKIYACSGIGSTDAKNGFYAYWTDNTNTVNNTQAVNTLLAWINRNYIEVMRLRGMTPAEKIANLNEIDLFTVCLSAAQRFSHYKQLEHAGRVIGKMLKEGAFEYNNLDATARDGHLDELLDRANTAFTDDTEIKSVDPEFDKWFDTYIIKRNKVGLDKEQREKIESIISKGVKKVSGTDWEENADLAEYLNKGSEYFLYIYLTDEQLRKLPSVFRLKRQKQVRTYNYCKQLFVDVYGSEEEMQEIIGAGIVNYFQETPEQVCADIVAGKRQGIGLATEIIVALISAAVTLVVGVITAICSMVATQDVAKYGALDKQIVETSTPDASDFDGLDMTNGGWKSTTSWLPIAAIGAALLLLFKK